MSTQIDKKDCAWRIFLKTHSVIFRALEREILKDQPPITWSPVGECRSLSSPFIYPLSDKNRDLSSKEIEGILGRLNIDRKVPLILQVGAGHKYVADHFLMPDRLADYLMAIDITRNASHNNEIPADAIISFHPWFKLDKRR